MSSLVAGQEVTVNSPGHGKDGRSGTVTYYSKFMGGWGVEIDGDTYGFFATELEATK